MAQKRCGMKTIRQILKLSQETGLSRRMIARATGASRSSVARYIDLFKKSGIQYDALKEMSDSKLLQLLAPEKKICHRLETLHELFPYMTCELRKVGVTRGILWEEYRKNNPDGYEYSQFCEHFLRWSKQDPEVTASINHAAGDRMYVDYAGKKLSYLCEQTGREIPVEFFIAILGASQKTYAEATPSQKKSDWLISNRNALEYFNGVPASIMPDCLKSGVTNGNKYEPEINPEYEAFAEHYSTVIIPARPRHPRDKALVESAVNILYTRIYAQLRNRTFYSIDELNDAIRPLLEKHNNTQFQKMPFSRESMFQEIERAALKPLPARRYELVEYRRQTVPPSYHVEIREDNAFYSVPWRFAGKKVTIACSKQTVEVYHDNLRIAFHSRKPSGRRKTQVTLPEHMPAHHRYQKELNAESVLQKAISFGSHTGTLIAAILSKSAHPEQGVKKAAGILNLAKKYTIKRLETACRIITADGDLSYLAVKKVLEKETDLKVAAFEKMQLHLPIDHENLRGQSAYN